MHIPCNLLSRQLGTCTYVGWYVCTYVHATVNNIKYVGTYCVYITCSPLSIQLTYARMCSIYVRTYHVSYHRWQICTSDKKYSFGVPLKELLYNWIAYCGVCMVSLVIHLGQFLTASAAQGGQTENHNQFAPRSQGSTMHIHVIRDLMKLKVPTILHTVRTCVYVRE